MENAKVALMFGFAVGVLWACSTKPASSSESQGQLVAAEATGPTTVVRQKWEYLVLERQYAQDSVKYTKGVTESWVNGKTVQGKKTFQILNELGRQGWEVVSSSSGASYGQSDGNLRQLKWSSSDFTQIILRRPL